MEEKKKLYKRLLAGFFLLMLLFTVLSRIIDTRQTAKVSTAYAERRPVVKTVEGEGVIEAKDMLPVDLIKGARVRRVESGIGTFVKEGDPLLKYDMDSLLKKQTELLKEINKLENQNEQERLGGKSFTGVTKEELAAQELAISELEYTEQAEKLNRAEEEYFQNLMRIKDYYDKRMALTKEELVNQSRLDFYESRAQVESMEYERDSEVRKLKRLISDTEKKIERLEAQEGGEEELEALLEALSGYEEDLEDAYDKWDLKIDQAEELSDEKGDIYDRAGKGMDSARLALTESYEAAVAQEEKNLEAARQELLKADHGVSRARQAVENGRKEDQAEALGSGRAIQLAELRCEANRKEIEALYLELSQLHTLINREGDLFATFSGTVAISEIELGKELLGNERFLLASGELQFKGSFDRESDGSLTAGDELIVKLEGEQSGFSVTVEQVDLVSSDEKAAVTGTIHQKEVKLGARAFFESKKSSDIYPTVIPLRSLRKDSRGEFCLVLRKYKTILGEEYRAARVDLKLIYSGDEAAAVEGALTEEEGIIVSSDRVIKEGDRVRLMKNLTEAG